MSLGKSLVGKLRCSRCPFDRAPVDVMQEHRLLSVITLLSFAALLSFVAAPTDAGFITAPSYAAGDEPFSVAVGDFNGDGILDLAVANYSNSSHATVSVLLGKGDGTFQAAQSYGVGSDADAVAVGDFNGDGHLDLAVANQGSNTVSVLLGNGDGTFQDAKSYSVGIYPTSVAVGDFNSDGISDLAVTGTGREQDYRGSVSILLGNGDGTFQDAHSYDAAGSATSFVALGDFNGDGHLDLALANRGTPRAEMCSVSVLLGNGDGTFQAAQTIANAPPGQPGWTCVAVGDFNGDGHLDIAASSPGENPDYKGKVSVLLGNGDGTFQPSQNYAVGNANRSMAVGDFNGDGISDLAVAGGAGVIILLGKGDGTFQPGQSLVAGFGPTSLAVGDFNGDGNLDIAVADVGNSVSILLGKGDGTFPQTAKNYGSGGVSVAAGDFNGDGILDLAVADTSNGVVNILLGNGDGSFRAAGAVAAGFERYPIVHVSVTAADLNGDGKDDIVTTHFVTTHIDYRDSRVQVWLSNGDGTFRASQTCDAGIAPSSVAVGDFNGDGILDLAVANSTYEGRVSVLLGNGDGTFKAAHSFVASQNPSAVAVGDFNRDGILDLAVAARSGVGISGVVGILLGNGDGTFRAAQNYATGSFPGSVVVADFNGDGISDLAVGNNDSGTVSVLLGNGDGSFQAAQDIAVAGRPISLAVGDFNRDGIPDLAVVVNGVSVLLGKGDGTFQPAQSYAAGSYHSVAVGDFNGDGYPDLAVDNTILLNDAHWGP